MGCICSSCSGKGGGGRGEDDHLGSPSHSSSSPRNSSVKAFNFVPIPLDDDWADEIWHDAMESHDGEVEQTFHVMEEELIILKEELGKQFPLDTNYMSDDYLISVASKPYSKDMSIRRPLEYTLEKLIHVMEWRKEMNASELPKLIHLCNIGGGDNVTTKREEVAGSAEQFKKGKAMVEALNTGSMYWHGLTKDGRPILWIRTNRKFWYPNIEAEVNALIVMADIGIQYMPEGVTDFCCISHSYKPPPPNPKFAYQMLRGLVKGYPDRMHLLISAPVSSIVEFCMNLLLPLMPGRLAHKFSFFSLEHVHDKLSDMLYHGVDDIPDFFGGPVPHDEYYPEEKYCPNRGEGSLKFDWYGMIERLQEQKRLFEEEQQQQQQHRRGDDPQKTKKK